MLDDLARRCFQGANNVSFRCQLIRVIVVSVGIASSVHEILSVEVTDTKQICVWDSNPCLRADRPLSYPLDERYRLFDIFTIDVDTPICYCLDLSRFGKVFAYQLNYADTFNDRLLRYEAFPLDSNQNLPGRIHVIRTPPCFPITSENKLG